MGARGLVATKSKLIEYTHLYMNNMNNLDEHAVNVMRQSKTKEHRAPLINLIYFVAREVKSGARDLVATKFKFKCFLLLSMHAVRLLVILSNGFYPKFCPSIIT